MSTTDVHTTAQEGFVEGLTYEKSRPSYTDELVNYVIQSLYTGAGQQSKYDILELGSGTGKFTRTILKYLKNPAHYLATDPSANFLETFKSLSPDVEAKQCDSTNIPVTDGSVQNIVCAQCFHWFANEVSLDEMCRVLVPGGKILLVWNSKDWDVGWVRSMEDILTRYYDGTPRAIKRDWKPVIERHSGLQFVEHKFLPGVTNMVGSKEFVIDHFSSISVIARLDYEEKKKVREEYKAVLDSHFKDTEQIHIPFYSEFYCVEKRK